MLALLCAASCKKENKNEDQLPPATQTGANTFGCLVNGKVYVPKGFNGTGTPNPQIQYSLDLNNKPYLGIIARQTMNSNINGEVLIAFRNLDQLGSFSTPTDFNFSFGWNDYPGCSTPAFDTTIQKWGSGVITKLDLQNNIISGTFDCKFKTLNCDTIFLTQGRFDIKL